MYMNKVNQSNGGNTMETLIKIEKTSTGFAHYIKQANGIVVIEFKGSK